MPVVATCGHTLKEIEGLGVTCSLKGLTKANERCIMYSSYCFACYEYAVAEGRVLYTEEHEDAWLDGEQVQISFDTYTQEWVAIVNNSGRAL